METWWRAASASPFVACDVTQELAVTAMVAEVVQRLGGIDVLFNNAGIINFGSVVDTRIDEWDALMATNVRGVFLVSRYVLPRMIAGGGGSVINMASNLGLVGTAARPRMRPPRGPLCSSPEPWRLTTLQTEFA